MSKTVYFCTIVKSLQSIQHHLWAFLSKARPAPALWSSLVAELVPMHMPLLSLVFRLAAVAIDLATLRWAMVPTDPLLAKVVRRWSAVVRALHFYLGHYIYSGCPERPMNGRQMLTPIQYFGDVELFVLSPFSAKAFF